MRVQEVRWRKEGDEGRPGKGALGHHRFSLGSPHPPHPSSAGRGQCCPEPAEDTGWAFPGVGPGSPTGKGKWLERQARDWAPPGCRALARGWAEPLAARTSPWEFGLSGRGRTVCLASQFCLLPPPLHPRRQRGFQETPGNPPSSNPRGRKLCSALPSVRAELLDMENPAVRGDPRVPRKSGKVVRAGPVVLSMICVTQTSLLGGWGGRTKKKDRDESPAEL